MIHAENEPSQAAPLRGVACALTVNLEFKSSRLLAKGETQSICKAISAFANSAGGIFIIGVQETDAGIALDGGWSGPSKYDWLHRTINDGTFPSVETATVRELSDGSGKYYVIEVGISSNAPHQSNDQKYYKRRGSHTDPMEHYEIEDVRNRPKATLAPLEMSIASGSQVARLKIRNRSDSFDIEHIAIEFKANFPVQKRSLGDLADRGIRRLHPHVEHVYLIESYYTALRADPEPGSPSRATRL